MLVDSHGRTGYRRLQFLVLLRGLFLTLLQLLVIALHEVDLRPQLQHIGRGLI